MRSINCYEMGIRLDGKKKGGVFTLGAFLGRVNGEMIQQWMVAMLYMHLHGAFGCVFLALLCSYCMALGKKWIAGF